MRLLFIRHAEAVEADDFDGDDLLRPLTKAGRKKAAAAYRNIFCAVPQPDLIVSSAAVRAKQTADILKKYARSAKQTVTPLLNPGRGLQGFRAFVKTIRKRDQTVAIVGHEPDLSHIISSIVAGGKLALRMKKGACADVEVSADGRGVLRSLLTPDALAGT